MHRFRMLLLVVAMSLLAACGGGSTDTPPEPAATATEAAPLPQVDLPPTATTVPEAQITATAEAVASGVAEPMPPANDAPTTNVYTVGVNASFEPFLFKDGSGNLAGIDIDLIQALGATADFEVAFVDTDFQELLDGVANGRYDLGMAAISITPDRAEQMLFSEPYFTTDQAPVSFFAAGQSLAVPVASTLNGVADLTDSSRVGVKTATTGAEYATENLRSEIQEYPESDVLLAALVAGEVDAAVLDSAVIADYIIANPGMLRLAGDTLVHEQYGIAVRPGGEEIVEKLNGALDDLKEDGVYNQIFARWFSQ